MKENQLGQQFVSVSPPCLNAHSNSLLFSPAPQLLPCGPNVKSGMQHPLAGLVSFDLLVTAPRRP